jgi:hypothetical protein
MFRAPPPSGLPPLTWLLHDQQANRPQVARHLGLSTRTLERYEAAQGAPRAVMLALFWESRWGRSAADAEAATAADVHRGHAAALGRENAALRRRIARLEAELQQAQPEAANLPFFAV